MESTISNEVPSIKSQLLDRFKAARGVVGKDWRGQLAQFDPYFNTKPGVDDMTLIGQAANEGSRRGQVDRIKRVVLAIERLAGIPHAPIL
ncbi:hypothetical protein ACWKW6_12935 [Dyadobacter jiangsuensis]